MATLKELYTTLKSLRDMNLPVDDKLLKAADNLEEKIIKEEILPALSQNIEPQLSEIQRDLVLVVEYHPGEPLSVALSRKAKISEIIDAKTLTPKSQTDCLLLNADNTIEAEGRDLRITIDGKVFQEKNSIQTFIAALKYIGLDRIPQVGITCSGYNLVDTRKRTDGTRKWQQEEDGKWVYIYFSNPTKVKYLFQIAKYLKESIQIEAI